MVEGKLVFVIAFALLAGVVSSFGSYRSVDKSRNRPNARRWPSAGPPRLPDSTLMKYVFGLTGDEIDFSSFNLATASKAYFNLFTVTGDAKLITSQFVQTAVLHNLLDVNKCFSTKIIRLVVVGIASELQDAILSEEYGLHLKLERLLPDLGRLYEDDEEDLSDLLATLLIKTTVFPILTEIVDFGFFENFSRKVLESLSENNDSLDDFINYIEVFRMTNPPPSCLTLEEVATILKEQIRIFPKRFTAGIFPIILELRNSIDSPGRRGNKPIIIGEFVHELEAEVMHVIENYTDIGTVTGLRDMMGYVAINLPADITIPVDPSVNRLFIYFTDKWIGDDGPLSDLVENLRNEDTDDDDDDDDDDED